VHVLDPEPELRVELRRRVLRHRRDAVRLVRQALPHGDLFRVGLNYWYLAPAGGATAVLKERHGLVEEAGIAVKQLTGSRKADRELMTSFD